jgi:hypothetical protein
MGIKVRVLLLIHEVIHMRKWISVLARNLVKTTVANARAKRAIGFTRKKGVASQTHCGWDELNQPPLRIIVG